jgi:drug/metabolite transporter (DMT)-like permease
MSQRKSRSYRYGDRIAPALLVIAVGVFFLLGNFGFDLSFFDFENWWAWFILAAAILPLSHALQRYRSAGNVDGVVLRSLLSATAIVVIALMFILELSWERWWPIFVIYGGLCLLSRGRRPASVSMDP